MAKFTYDDFKYDAYKESDLVNEAKNALDTQLANKPGAYQSQWQNQLNDTIGKILNREKFSYNFNDDALYQTSRWISDAAASQRIFLPSTLHQSVYNIKRIA